MRLLVVEDDRPTAKLVRAVLEDAGYAVDVAFTGEEGRMLSLVNSYDGILLDVELSDRNGLTILAELRRENIRTPVMVLSGRGESETVVRALDAGADDYVVKPVPNEVLSARVRALLRRQGERPTEHLRLGDLVVNRLTRETMHRGVALALTPKEFALLEYLLLHPNEVVSRSRLREAVWDMAFDPESNIVDAVVNRLRRKLEQVQSSVVLTSVRGVGYRAGSQAPE